MAKIKVYELAKELNVQSKDVLEFLESKKIEVKKSHECTGRDCCRSGKRTFQIRTREI